MGGGPPASAGSSGRPCGDCETSPEAGERDVGGCKVRRGEDWAGGDVTKGLLNKSCIAVGSWFLKRCRVRSYDIKFQVT